MKTKHFFGLLALLFLTACDKPKPLTEQHQLTIKTFFPSRIGDPRSLIDPWPTARISLYSYTSYIGVDTVWYSVNDTMRRRIEYVYPPKGLLYQSTTIDSVHKMNVTSGDYIMVVDYLYNPFFPHFSRIGVISDTVISDTLNYKLSSDYDKLY